MPSINQVIEKLAGSDNYQISDAAYQVKRDIERLYEQALYLRAKAETVMRYCIDAKMNVGGQKGFYSSVNSLGELQGSAPMFDIQCALLQRSIDNLNTVLSEQGYKYEKTNSD